MKDVDELLETPSHMSSEIMREIFHEAVQAHVDAYWAVTPSSARSRANGKQDVLIELLFRECGRDGEFWEKAIANAARDESIVGREFAKT